jgi:hypothetical protein
MTTMTFTFETIANKISHALGREVSAEEATHFEQIVERFAAMPLGLLEGIDLEMLDANMAALGLDARHFIFSRAADISKERTDTLAEFAEYVLERIEGSSKQDRDAPSDRLLDHRTGEFPQVLKRESIGNVPSSKESPASPLRVLHRYATAIRWRISVAPRTDSRRDHNRRRDHDGRNVSGRHISVRHAVAHAVAVGAAVKAKATEASHLQDLRRRRLSRRDWKGLGLEGKDRGHHTTGQNRSCL